jgi:hypothetical protein
MNKSAVAAASASLDKASASIQVLRSATTFSEFESAWTDFLLAAGRVFSKLEQGAKHDGNSSAWFGRHRGERRADPLLSYLHHARNADEHGIERITELKPGSIKFGSTGATHIKKMTISGGRVEAEISGSPLKFAITPSTARLIAVTDRGVVYTPPTEHLGKPIQDQSAVGIAELAASYLRAMIESASRLP